MKIGLTGNFIRFSESDIFNVDVIKFLLQIIKIPLNKMNNVEIQYLFPPILNRDDLFAHGRVVENNLWSSFQEENSEINREDLNDCLFGNDVIIGFEMPPSVCRIFSAEKVRYINLFIHPVRFLPDLLWCFTTNDENIGKRLNKWNYSYENIEHHVDTIRTLCIRQNAQQQILIKPNTIAIIGQTEGDSSLLKNKQFVTFKDYMETIEKKCSQYENVLIIPHPYSNSNTFLEEFSHSLGCSTIANYNTYSILSNDNIKAILTLSSSVGVESEYFGKKVEFLIGPALRKGGSMVASDVYVATIGQEILMVDFWKYLLEPNEYEKFQVFSLEQNTFAHKNLFRSLFGGWAYDELIKNKDSELILACEQELLNLQKRQEQMTQEIRNEKEQMTQEIRRQEQMTQEIRNEKEHIEHELQLIKSSNSWKMTEPLRILKKIISR